MTSYAVETRELCRTFTSKEKRGEPKKVVNALENANLTVKPGELFGVLGPNGAGKTTLIKILSTLLLPTKGEAFVHGHSVKTESHKIRYHINMVCGGESSGYGLLTVRENLWMFSQFYGIPSKLAKGRIDELLGVMNLQDKGDAKVRTLSTGMRQKMNMVRGFMTDPAIIFLDEPTLGLDVTTSRQIRLFVKEWVKAETDRTVLLTTHYMMEADELCDRIAIIDKGTVLACDTPENLKRRVKRESVLRIEVTGMGDAKPVSGIKGIHAFNAITDPAKGVTTISLILDEESAISDILSAITKGGGRIQAMQKTDPTLEDVFITLVGRGLENDNDNQP
ncbi:MAG: ATP-binding cassette domain-containing protein [Euryarchaeota archaeon]|nr:ATP-binding cassette domain-containing protein [Euryarchaeota archaeon]